jgi:hypothetical protein
VGTSSHSPTVTGSNLGSSALMPLKRMKRKLLILGNIFLSKQKKKGKKGGSSRY